MVDDSNAGAAANNGSPNPNAAMNADAAANNANVFRSTLARENSMSRVQAQILLARKLAERQRCMRRIRNLRDRLRRLARQLATEEVNLFATDADANHLTDASVRGDDN